MSQMFHRTEMVSIVLSDGVYLFELLKRNAEHFQLLISLVLSHMPRSQTPSVVTVSDSLFVLVLASGSAVLTHITMCTCGVPSELVCQPTAASIALQLTTGLLFVGCLLDIAIEWSHCDALITQIKKWWVSSSCVQVFLVVGTVAHSFSLLSSSFVEEEHQTFYFLTSAVHLLLLLQVILCFLTYSQSQLKSEVTKRAHAHVQSSDQTSIMDLVLGLTADKYARNNSCKTQPSPRGKMDNVRPETNSDYFVSQTSSDQACLSQSHQQFFHLSKKDDDADPVGEHTKNKPQTEARKISHTSPSSLVHFTVSLVVVLIILRILRRWNQTGNKWLDVPDFGDWLILPENKHYLSLLVLFSLMMLAVIRGSHLGKAQNLCVRLSLAAVYLYRVADGNLFFPSTWFLSPRGILEARAAFFFIGVNLLVSLLPSFVFRLDATEANKPLEQTESKENTSADSKQVKGGKMDKSSLPLQTSANERLHKRLHQKLGETKPLPVAPSEDQDPSSKGLDREGEDVVSPDQRLKGVMSAFLCFMCLVMRPHNVPVVVAMSLVEQMVTPVLLHCALPLHYILLYCLWMGQAFFFFQGNSNSLSTVELTAGYTGLQDFMPGITGCLLCLSTYSATIFWALTYFRISAQLAQTNSEQSISRAFVLPCSTMLLSQALPLAVYTALTSAQRYHLFVWTVFSPKLLYEGVYTGVLSTLALLLYVWTCLHTSPWKVSTCSATG